jgi:hypothetical protein
MKGHERESLEVQRGMATVEENGELDKMLGLQVLLKLLGF